eukprot:10269816-Alexandrium_andersonii.AAC.1
MVAPTRTSCMSSSVGFFLPRLSLLLSMEKLYIRPRERGDGVVPPMLHVVRVAAAGSHIMPRAGRRNGC